MPKPNERDLRETFLTPLRKCADYKPAFGQEGNGGISLAEFFDRHGPNQPRVQLSRAQVRRSYWQWLRTRFM